MVASLARRAPITARCMLGAALLVAGTDPAAHQDLANLLVQQPGLAERAHRYVRAASFAALRTATFSLPNPIGAAIPRFPAPDHFQAINAALPGPAPALPARVPRPREAQIPNREAKRDRLMPGVQAIVRTLRMHPQRPAPPATADYTIEEEDYLAVVDSAPFEGTPEFAGTIARAIDPTPPSGEILHMPHLFFGTDESELPPLVFQHAPISPVERLRLAALPDSAMEDGTSVAAKGMVTGEEATPKSPAERLKLAGAERSKAEKCLADAIYFESRGEAERGQVAVAQVVINRVFSGYYPEDVCGTVYQNAHRHLACQFTFACEGKKLIVNDQGSWRRATRIARDMLEGKLWLNDVGKATHYHANWVSPDWIREMRKIQRIGVHTFYRPRKWEEEES